jgi:PAS domain S-box-containing protein
MGYLQSLTGRLFKLVFGGYLILAIVVTVVQLSLEYSSIQHTIRADLASLGDSFDNGAAEALWELDRPLLKTMAQGIAQSSIVTGVKITGDNGESMALVGEIPAAGSATSNDLLAPFQSCSKRLLKQTPNGMRDIGSLTIYTDRSVALKRVRYSFFIILINSLIKTAGLWAIFYIVIYRGLARPLSRVTEVVSQLEFAAESKQEIALDYPHEDELGRLMAAMRKMQNRLSIARRELDMVNVHLEETVAERTQSLSEFLNFNETILLNSPLSMGVYAANGQCVLANEAYADLTGATRKSLLSQNFNEIAAWEKSGLFDALLTALEDQTPQQLEINVVSSFGKQVWVDCRILPTHLNNNDHLLVQFIDLSERKRAEVELRKLSRAVEQSPVTIVITDVNGLIEFVNPRFTETTGYSAEEAIGQNPRVLKSGKTSEKVYKDLWAAITSGDRWEGEFLNKCKDGRMFWEHARISPLRNAEGVTTHYLAVKEDITEKKQIIEQLVIAKQNADAANRAKSEFLANMSHEIRTPMNGILGMAQLMDFTDLTEEQRDYLDTIRASSNNLLTLINDVLDLSKIESGKIELEEGDFGLRVTVSDVIKTQVSLAHSKRISIKTDISAEVPDNLCGDQLRLKQVLHNLLSNAIKFTSQGGIRVSVSVSERLGDTALLKIGVSDTGIGISPEAVQKIFEPFSQADASTTRKYGGTGLGLSISTRLVELMGGSIWVESTEGVGSTFFIQIPYLVNEATIEPYDGRIADNASALWDGPPLSVLVVDDTEVNRRVAAGILQKIGLSVTEACDGREALQHWEHTAFDLVLMDIQMPVMDGIEAARTIREIEKETGQRTPIMALTARALREEQEKILSEGFDGYVSKPIMIDVLLDEMKRVLSASYG